MTELPAQRLLLDATRALDAAGIPSMVIGGFAVRVWAIPRPTYDVDLVVPVATIPPAAVLDALRRAGFDVPQEHAAGHEDSVAGLAKVRVTRFEDGSVWDVDVFLARGGFLAAAFDRRRQTTVDGVPISVAAPEDLILLKLLANRRKDLVDVEDILLVAGPGDVEHLRRWADRLGVRDRLDGFLATP